MPWTDQRWELPYSVAGKLANIHGGGDTQTGQEGWVGFP